jgi:predicted RNase H-like nuclease (RuvC/YqgF family)
VNRQKILDELTELRSRVQEIADDVRDGVSPNRQLATLQSRLEALSTKIENDPSPIWPLGEG